MPKPNNWSDAEVRVAVADYFHMLRLELAGEPYNKTTHRRALQARLDQRSEGAVELKHQNISAVLIEMGIPYIDGYKPRQNYQQTLVPAIGRYLQQHAEIDTLLQRDAAQDPPSPDPHEWDAILDEPPAPDERAPATVGESRAPYLPGTPNYFAQEAANQALGEAGEQFVMHLERARLIQAGKASLADRIEQVSVSVGPAAGYDIHSFENDGSERFIEVKTTRHGKHSPFFITQNELQFSREQASTYHLYRLFRFRHHPRLYTLQGVLEAHCSLQPTVYMARPGRSPGS